MSHFNRGLRVKLQPTGSQSFAAGQVRERFALRGPKLTLFTDIWVHGKRITSSEVLSKWTSVCLGLHSDIHRKLICLDLRRRWKKKKVEESGVERKCRKVWDGVTKAGKKADSLSSHGSSLSATFVAMFPAAIMKANQTKWQFQEAISSGMEDDKT